MFDLFFDPQADAALVQRLTAVPRVHDVRGIRPSPRPEEEPFPPPPPAPSSPTRDLPQRLSETGA